MSRRAGSSFRHPRIRRALRLALLVPVLLGFSYVGSAQAWKPYTHNFTGDNAYTDAAADCSVRIANGTYNLEPRLCEALQKKRSYYNAGVVGPDGYPDLVMGQAVIHPGEGAATTGKWLRWVLAKAWAAQCRPNAPCDPGYTNDQQLEILAFAYGFMTHAAGDMWGHTLANDFAKGVFPPVGEIPTDPAKAAIAFRHLVVEAYVGDATPGFDGNPDRTLVPNEANKDGTPEVSDDATPAIAYGIPPDRFLWEVFVGRQADGNGKLTQPLPGQPTAARGPLIEFFYNLRNDLDEEANTFSTVQAAIDALNDLKAKLQAVVEKCSPPPNVVECPIALARAGISAFTAFATESTILIRGAVELVVDAYLRAWVNDIDNGLRNWSNVGNAFTAGLFDPHQRRNAQDDQCAPEWTDGEFGPGRSECEKEVGLFDSLWYVLGDSTTTKDPKLLSMLGIPDAALFAADTIGEVTKALDDALNLPGVKELKAEIKDKLESLLLDAANQTLGVDFRQLEELTKNPATYLDAALPSPPFPSGTTLFNTGDHQRLDTIIGLANPGPGTSHHTGSNRLQDDVELSISSFPPLKNTITTAKLLLLGGAELNRSLGDILGREVETYTGSVTNNVMTDALGDGDPWLRSIDSDHAWRQDGLPVFCDVGTDCGLARPGSYTRSQSLRGGTGKMPIWESCVLRPAFGVLFTDWENGSRQWPALGDGVSADPASDDWAPRSYLAQQSGASFVDQTTGRKFVGANNVFTITARDDVVPNRGFADSALGIRYRITTPGGSVGSWIVAQQNAQFSLSSAQGGDGKYVVEVEAEDPCHTFAAGDGLDPSGTTASFEYWLDTTPPKVTFASPPFGLTFDTDDFSTVDYAVDDGPNGSGVASESSTIDGYRVLPGVVATSDGAVLDMYQYYPGARTVGVTATDNIGNTGTSSGTFRIEATPDSLINNLNRARTEGKVPYTDVYNGLMDKLVQVRQQHAKRKHETEWNILYAFVDQLEGQRGKGIDLVVANRFIAYARLRVVLRQ